MPVLVSPPASGGRDRQISGPSTPPGDGGPVREGDASCSIPEGHLAVVPCSGVSGLLPATPRPYMELSFLGVVTVGVATLDQGGRSFGGRGVPRPEGGPIDARDSADL